jgi:hypothetical protein
MLRSRSSIEWYGASELESQNAMSNMAFGWVCVNFKVVAVDLGAELLHDVDGPLGSIFPIYRQL